MKETQITVAKYLQIRLEQMGLRHLFGIAGNYTAPFLNTILEDKQAKIQVINDTNEINAGHCTDAYARLNGFAAVAVTYGVGAFTLLNSVAGSYVEHCPVLVINGAPTNSDQLKNIAQGMLSSHMTGDMYSNINVYRNVTVAAEQVTSSADAPYKIDAILNACILYGKPVYLEVFEDVWRISTYGDIGAFGDHILHFSTFIPFHLCGRANIGTQPGKPGHQRCAWFCYGGSCRGDP
jgi:indolepyruvate decarboxylase